MINLRTLAVLFPLFLFTGCGSDAGAAADPGNVAGSLESLLEGVTDKASAEAAKEKLGTLTEELSGAMSNLTSAAESAGDEAKDKLGALAEQAKGAMNSLTPELTKSFNGVKEQITRLMGNEEVKQVLGPVLEKLKNLIPS